MLGMNCPYKWLPLSSSPQSGFSYILSHSEATASPRTWHLLSHYRAMQKCHTGCLSRVLPALTCRAPSHFKCHSVRSPGLGLILVHPCHRSPRYVPWDSHLYLVLCRLTHSLCYLLFCLYSPNTSVCLYERKKGSGKDPVLTTLH